MNSKLNVTITPLINSFDSQSETLILNQTADPLFNGVAWQKAWWSRWGSGLELTFTRVKDAEDTVCSLPLYIDSFKFKHIFSIRRLQFIGTNYQNISTPRAEYLAFSTVTGYESALFRGLSALESLNWNEFVARDIVKADSTDKAITQWAKDNNWLTRVIHTDTAYNINTTTSFEIYKKNLGSNTRLKLINRRKLLETLGDVAIENYYPERVTDFFDLMNDFHKRRWGDSFSPKTLSFHQEIINNSQQGGLEVDLSVLTVNGQCESVMFNYVLNGRVYNINSGFNEHFNKKISIGMLHFGYMIEAAFGNPNIKVFDFLAGLGKNSNYKSKLATDSVDLYSIQIVRSKLLSTLYITKAVLEKIKKNIMIFSNFIFKWVK